MNKSESKTPPSVNVASTGKVEMETKIPTHSSHRPVKGEIRKNKLKENFIQVPRDDKAPQSRQDKAGKKHS